MAFGAFPRASARYRGAVSPGLRSPLAGQISLGGTGRWSAAAPAPASVRFVCQVTCVGSVERSARERPPRERAGARIAARQLVT